MFFSHLGFWSGNLFLIAPFPDLCLLVPFSDLDGIFTINEIKLFLIMFADDQVLFATNPTTLQSMLSNIESYCNTWKLKINVNKTKVLIFEKGNQYTNYDFYLYNEKLEVVSSFKYLGIYFF